MIRTNLAAQIRFDFLSLCLLVQGRIRKLHFLDIRKLVVQEKLL